MKHAGQVCADTESWTVLVPVRVYKGTSYFTNGDWLHSTGSKTHKLLTVRRYKIFKFTECSLSVRMQMEDRDGNILFYRNE